MGHPYSRHLKRAGWEIPQDEDISRYLEGCQNPGSQQVKSTTYMFIYMKGTLLTLEDPLLRLFRLGPAFDTHRGMLQTPRFLGGESSILMVVFGDEGSFNLILPPKLSLIRGGVETSKSAVLTGAF